VPQLAGGPPPPSRVGLIWRQCPVCLRLCGRVLHAPLLAAQIGRRDSVLICCPGGCASCHWCCRWRRPSCARATACQKGGALADCCGGVCALIGMWYDSRPESCLQGPRQHCAGAAGTVKQAAKSGETLAFLHSAGRGCNRPTAVGWTHSFWLRERAGRENANTPVACV
jgi:hypothetical protein